jgi:hypothetical protein
VNSDVADERFVSFRRVAELDRHAFLRDALPTMASG